jgi:protocatechuate 3,4-dioxygenase beta subunit
MVGRCRAVAGSLLVLGAMAGVAGCEAGEPEAAAPTPVATSAAVGTRCPATAPGPADAGSVLVPGPTDGLPPSAARGEPLVIAAVVLDPACQPASGANVELHHTDANGRYRPEGSEACCYYRGSVRTDHNGRFRVETIRPAQYPQPGAPPAHIHLEIRHPSGELRTEIVFVGGFLDGTLPVLLERRGDSWYGAATMLLAGR